MCSGFRRGRAGWELLVLVPGLPWAGLRAVSLFTLTENCECCAPVSRFTTNSGCHADLTKGHFIVL